MKILLADDHELVRDALAAFLEKADGIKVVSVADLGEVCETLSQVSDFDLVLLDYTMPGMHGLSGLRRAIDVGKGVPVALMSGTASKSVAQEALDCGAIGFFPKTMGAASLVHAVKFMAAGEVFVPITFMTHAPKKATTRIRAGLSPREIDVLGGLCRGLTNKEIAREFSLQEATIKLHVKTLSRKLNAKNRTHAAMIAKETGLY